MGIIHVFIQETNFINRCVFTDTECVRWWGRYDCADWYDCADRQQHSTAPVDSATSVARNSTVTATFNEDMFATTVDATSFTLSKSGAINGAVTFEGSTNVATFTPGNELAILATYTATLSTAMTDLSGNPLAANYSWSFITAEGAWQAAEQNETHSVRKYCLLS